MIGFEAGIFPSGITTVLKQTLENVGTNLTPSVTIPVVERALRTTDPALALALFPLDWKPGEAFEIANDRLGEPLLPRYRFEIQALVKVTEEAAGRAAIANLSKIVRAMLYRDQDLQLALRGLSESSFGFVERVKRWGVPDQVFYSNEVKGSFLFLSSTYLWVEVESIPA